MSFVDISHYFNFINIASGSLVVRSYVGFHMLETERLCPSAGCRRATTAHDKPQGRQKEAFYFHIRHKNSKKYSLCPPQMKKSVGFRG
jgi:hypothetical protein